MILMLSGCSSTVSDAIEAQITPNTSTGFISSKKKLDNIAGTMGHSMDLKEKTFTAKSALSTRLDRVPGGTSLTVASGPSFSAKKNFIGGLDVEVDGKTVSLRKDEVVSATAWYKSTGTTNNTRFSLSLWNAGRDARGGLLTNAAGQNFHKIVGYDFTDGTKIQSRGHVVYGEATSFADLQALKKTATYEGYFSVFMTKKDMDSDHYDRNSAIMSGGAEFIADFDNNKISGTSTNVTMREAGSNNFSNQNFDVRFQTTDIVNDGAGGVIYYGALASDHDRIDGAEYKGSLFGPDAQEVAGIITGDTVENATGDDYVVDGFFSAAR